MSVPLSAFDRYYPTNLRAGYASSSVGREWAQFNEQIRRQGSSHTVRQLQPNLLAAVWNAGGEPAVSAATTEAAARLVCALPEGIPAPEITPEPTGEIAFEWYRDSGHVAVLSIQDGIIRWSALLGSGAPVYGREYFTGTVPGAAMLAIRTVIG